MKTTPKLTAEEKRLLIEANLIWQTLNADLLHVASLGLCSIVESSSEDGVLDVEIVPIVAGG